MSDSSAVESDTGNRRAEQARYILGQPISGVEHGIEEVALVFALGARDAAAALVGHSDITQQALEARETVRQLEQGVARGRARLAEFEAQQVEHEETRAGKMLTRSMKIGVGVTAGGLVLALVGAIASLAWLLVLGLLVASGCGGFVMNERAKAKRTFDKQAAALEHETSQCQDSLRTEQFHLKNSVNRLAELDATLASFAASRSIAAVGRIYYPLRTLDMAGYRVLVDSLGLTPGTDFEIPDLATQPDVISRVAATVERTSHLPILLSPTQSRSNAIDALYGEEAELRAALDEFSAMVAGIPVYKRRLPIVRKDSKLARLAETSEATPSNGLPGGPVLASAASERTEAAIDELGEVARRQRAIGGQADEVLRDTHGRLESNLVAYQRSRGHAVDILHGEFLVAMRRSSLLSVVCYCPKCNRVPDYLLLKLGVPLEEAHLADQRQLLSHLNEDDEIARRLDGNVQFVSDLNRAYSAWKLLQIQLERTCASEDADAEAEADLSEWQASLARNRALRNQADVVVQEYRSILRAMVTGHSRPLLELARQARLRLDPVHDVWRCAVCDTAFDDPSIAEMGRLLRVKDDLVMPIWNHLWTEKDDFRKSEQFRTNEALQVMAEKESEKLLSIAESYKADMRPVRENIIRYAAEAENKQRQLVDTIEGLVQMGLMTEAKAEEVQGRIAMLMRGSISDTKRAAETKELMLTLEPQAQLSRRPSADDPINMLLSPSALFTETEEWPLFILENAAEIDQVEPLQIASQPTSLGVE